MSSSSTTNRMTQSVKKKDGGCLSQRERGNIQQLTSYIKKYQFTLITDDIIFDDYTSDSELKAQAKEKISQLAQISSGIQPINPDEPSTGGVETVTDGDDSSQHLQSSCQEIIAVPCLENSSIIITEALQNVTATDSAAAPTELSMSCTGDLKVAKTTSCLSFQRR